MTSILDRPLKARTFPGLGQRRRAANHLATVLVTTAMLVALAPLLLVLYSVVAKGIKAVVSTEWWTHSQAGMTAFVAGSGAGDAVLGTLLQGSLCAVLAIPIGVMVAVYLVEYGGGTRCGRLISFMVDILSGVPSIVAALFIYALWAVTLGISRSSLALALALVLLMLPVIARATEEMLRIVPADLREASYALGIPKWKTIVRVVIPTGLSGIATGIMLAVARVMGETAPLLILVGYSQSMADDVFHGFRGSLPGMIYNQASAGAGVNPVPTDRLWGAALTLILLIAVINLGARMIAKVFAPRSQFSPRSHRQEH
ncbi:MAG: phosphate ABC transporter permease PstA [Mycobacterium sp.]|nr:phosphate ABC transporter permease PstA [Mycobacterium sp.]